MDIRERIIKKLETSDGKIPFDDWYFSLRDRKARAVIAARLLRIQAGNLGDVKSIDKGVFEFCIHYGSGFRIYFVEIGKTIIVLLCGGDKRSQAQDIQEAMKLWERYRNEIERYSREL